MQDSEMNSLLDRFFDAIERHDMATVSSLYAPTATVWHCYDDCHQSRADNLQVIDGFPSRFKTFEYFNMRRLFFKGGCVQQHALKGIANNGNSFFLLACMVIRIDDAQITGIEEYFDTAQVPAA